MSLSLDISPARLFLSLGVVQHSYDTELHQFLGKVTNIRVYRGLAMGEGEMEEMTRSPCLPSSLQTFLLWEEMQWRVTGEAELTPLTETIICSESQHHPVLLPTPLSYHAAKAACFKLGEGTIAEPTASILESIGETCRYIWTPYTDAQTEGIFVNENTGKVARYSQAVDQHILIGGKLSSNLDWLGEQPNGKEKQNFVAADLHQNNSLSGSLYDVGETVLNCAVCLISGK